MYALDFSLLFNNIIENIDNFTEEELKEQFNLLYKQIKLPDEIATSNYLKSQILKAIKDIITLYKYKNMVINKSRNNHLCGSNPTNLINTDFASPYDFLKLDLDDFEISKFNIMGNMNSVQEEINISNMNFFPAIFKVFSDNYKITTKERKINFKRTGLNENYLQYTSTYTYYINSIVDSIHQYSYNLKNIDIENYKKLGLNSLLEIVYYKIEQAKIKPSSSLIIERCHKYPEYVEVTLNDTQKFLTTIDLKNGINSLTVYNKPFKEAITRTNGNVYTSYILSHHKIESKEEELVNDLQDEQEKNDFTKYYKYVNKTL